MLDLVTAAGLNLPGLEVYSVPAGEATEDIRGMLLRAEEWSAGDVEVEDWIQMHARGRAQLFVGLRDSGLEAVMLTEFVQYPRRKVLVILALAGRAKQFAPFMKFIEHWAELNGAEAVEAYCREAMVRYAERYGFVEVRRVIRKTVERRFLQ